MAGSWLGRDGHLAVVCCTPSSEGAPAHTNMHTHMCARSLQLHHRHERLRQRVEADSDTASAALRSLSTAMDDAVGGVARRAEAAAGAAAAAHAASGAVEEALRAEVHARVREQSGGSMLAGILFATQGSMRWLDALKLWHSRP